MGLTDWWHQPRAAKRMLFGLTVVTLLQAAALVVIAWPDAERWDPIVPFEQQTITNEKPIGYDDALIIEGVKCYREPVTVVVHRWWATTDPIGPLVPDGGWTVNRPAGCARFSGDSAFRHAVPDLVEALDREMRAQGIDPVWYLFGNDHAERGNESSVERTWRTESFRFGG